MVRGLEHVRERERETEKAECVHLAEEVVWGGLVADTWSKNER